MNFPELTSVHLEGRFWLELRHLPHLVGDTTKTSLLGEKAKVRFRANQDQKRSIPSPQRAASERIRRVYDTRYL